MLYNADGFSLALGPASGPILLPEFLHFGVHLGSADEVRALRERFAASNVPIVGE